MPSNGQLLYIIDCWIVDKLTSDSRIASAIAKRVFSEKAPPQSPVPHIIFSFQGSQRNAGGFGTVLATQPNYLVKACTSGQAFGPINNLAGYIEDILPTHECPDEFQGVAIYCKSDQPYKGVETDRQSGQPSAYLGAYYYIFAQVLETAP